jgi:tetratricopeptide (TPR) repeat protein
VVDLYFHSYCANENLKNNTITKSEKHFQALKKLIQQHWKTIPPNEIRAIYLYAINYCIKRLNSGERHFIREGFELFRSGLENETLLEEGILSSFTYKNITRLGMALSENKWVEQFLADYKKYLHPRERENTWRYNLAFFYFQQEKYKDAMQLLLRVEFKDVLNNLDARRMLLKSYFELGEYNALDSLLDSFSRYIHRQKEMGYHRDNYLNLIRFVKKIIHSREEDKKIWKHLKEEIGATNRLAEREWLLEKLKMGKNKF